MWYRKARTIFTFLKDFYLVEGQEVRLLDKAKSSL